MEATLESTLGQADFKAYTANSDSLRIVRFNPILCFQNHLIAMISMARKDGIEPLGSRHQQMSPLKGDSPRLNLRAQLLLEVRLRKVNARWGIVKAVEMMVRRNPRIEIDAVCEALSLARRSLQRRLKETGTSFAQIQTQVRYELASFLLLNRDLTIDDVSIKLGFTDRNGFAKAFTKWSGQSPGQVRRNAIAGEEM